MSGFPPGPHRSDVRSGIVLVVLFRLAKPRSCGFVLGSDVGFDASFGVPSLLAAEIYTALPLTVLCACIVISFQRVEVCDWVGTLTWRRALALAPLLLVSLATMFTQAFNPFLYFQF